MSETATEATKVARALYRLTDPSVSWQVAARRLKLARDAAKKAAAQAPK
jgi:hypothetical protein